MNRYWNSSLEALDSEADLLSSGGSASCNGSSPMSLAITLGDRRCLSLWSACSTLFSQPLTDKIAALVRISLGLRLPFASKVALLSRDSLGASLQDLQDDFVPSFNSNTEGVRCDFDWISTGIGDSGAAGDRISVTGDCLNLSGEGIDLVCCDFSNSLDIAGDPIDFSDFGVESTPWKFPQIMTH